MDFTREPIIETIITPKDGYWLVIKNSKGSGSEHVVDAVEVISFGTTYFLRSLEKPAAFLLPFGEYEITEKKITKAALKKPQVQKSIKIDSKDKKTPQEDLDSDLEMEKEQKEEAKAEKSKAGRRKRAAKKADAKAAKEEIKDAGSKEAKEAKEVTPPSLLPPPTTLISDQILRYKDYLQTEKSAPLSTEHETKSEATSDEVEQILLSSTPENTRVDDKQLDVPLSVMKEADDFITKAQEDMFNKSLEEADKEEKEPVAKTLNCTTPPPLVTDKDKS